MRISRSCFVLGLLLGLAPALAQAVSIEQIPSPRPTGWAVDLTSTLPAATLAELNRLGDDVKVRTGAELAVVVIGSTDGAEPHAFATRLFNAWGLGERGKDNGLLVFTALDDHRVEIVLGDGLSHGEGSAVSGLIIQEEMIPRFRAGDAAGAILAGARACVQRILEVTPQAFSAGGGTAPSPAVQPFARPPDTYTPSPVRSRFDPRVLFPIGLAGSIVAAFWFVLRKPRCARCKQKMEQLGEAEDDAYLDQTEQLEERIGSVDHQVWVCPSCGERVRRRAVRFLSGYANCPDCSARTLRSTTTVRQQATQWQGGLEEVQQTCVSCGYANSYTQSTPALQRPSFTVGRSGGGSSHSSGSGFGGGRSSGGGASGSW